MINIYAKFDCPANAMKVIRAYRQIYQYKFADAIVKCIIESEFVEKAKKVLSHATGFVCFVEC